MLLSFQVQPIAGGGGSALFYKMAGKGQAQLRGGWTAAGHRSRGRANSSAPRSTVIQVAPLKIVFHTISVHVVPAHYAS